MPRPGTRRTPERVAKDAAATAKWQKENTVIIPVRVRRQKRDEYKTLAAARGESLSGLIVRLLEKEMEKTK